MTDPASAGTAAPLVDPGGEILLDVSNLSKDFGGLRAVSALSFRAREGEFVGVIGPNGAGKTTLFALFPHLRSRKGQFCGTLSGGEQQMVAIGRGLMGAPRLLLMDEPSLGLAPLIIENPYVKQAYLGL